MGDSDKKVIVRWELAERQPRSGYDLEIEWIRVWCDVKPIVDELQSHLSLAILGWCTLFASEGLWSVCGVVYGLFVFEGVVGGACRLV